MCVPKISVVIPVYMVEQYLRRCVDSVVSQTMRELQIILVDDGSPDNCPDICDEYALSDSRVEVIHKSNGGVASARNAGMRRAKGKYLFFLDSDDWLELDGLKMLYNCAEQQKVDFVRYRAFRSNWPNTDGDIPCRVEDVRELRGGYYNKQEIEAELYNRMLATNQLTMGAVVGAWGSLYNLDFLRKNDLYFYEEVKFSEDLVFSARVIRAANSFFFIDTPCVYHYFYNPASISKSFRAGRWESCKSLIKACESDFTQDKKFDYTSQLYFLKWFCILLTLNERRHLNGFFERYSYCKSLLSDDLTVKTKLKLSGFDISWKQKLILILVRLRASAILALI